MTLQRFLFYLYFFVFRILAHIRPSSPIQLKGLSFQRILIFSAAGIGDTLTDSVAIRALKEIFPQAKLTVVTHRRRATLVQHNPFVDEVILYHKSLIRFITLAMELRQRKPEVIVMLRGNDPDLWPMAYLVNRHAIVSCPIMTRFKFLISHPVQVAAWDQTHGVEQTLEIVRSIGADTKDRRLVYQVREDECDPLQKKLLRHGLTEKPRIIFQVGGGKRSAWRDWPVEYFIELARKLLTTYEVQLVLLGGKDLCTKAEALHAALPSEVMNLVGKLSLSESAALLSFSKILVSTDTGIMHLGFAVGIDTLALIHCHNPASRVGPYSYGEKHQVVQLEPPPGIPVSKEVRMTLLTPERVWTELEILCERHRLPKKSSLK